MPTPVAAANAYAALARLVPAASPGASPTSEGGGFGSLLQGALDKFVDVVTAVAESEVAVSTLVSVRDKVIAAYEEIMRMPI
jgi:flagellar hook-basal body complex protein FliE